MLEMLPVQFLTLILLQWLHPRGEVLEEDGGKAVSDGVRGLTSDAGLGAHFAKLQRQLYLQQRQQKALQLQMLNHQLHHQSQKQQQFRERWSFKQTSDWKLQKKTFL